MRKHTASIILVDAFFCAGNKAHINEQSFQQTFALVCANCGVNINMPKFLKKSSLPEGKVVSVIAGERYMAQLSGPLERMGASYIPMPDCSHVMPALSGHADLVISHLGENRFIIAKNAEVENVELVNILTNSGGRVRLSTKALGNVYPDDVILNCCIIGDKLLCNTHHTDPSVLEMFPKRIHVKQGYAKCAVCVVDDNSAITSDEGIYKQMQRSGIDVLLISPGYIELRGFDTGFIGGSSFKLAPNIMAFTGSLDMHPDGQSIFSFLSRKGISSICLTTEPIFDVGSVIPVFEQ